MQVDPKAKLQAEAWLASSIAESDKAVIRSWMASDPAALNEAFSFSPGESIFTSRL